MSKKRFILKMVSCLLSSIFSGNANCVTGLYTRDDLAMDSSLSNVVKQIKCSKIFRKNIVRSCKHFRRHNKFQNVVCCFRKARAFVLKRTSLFLLPKAGLPDRVKFGKPLAKFTVFQKVCQLYLATFVIPKFCHFLTCQLPALTKQSILDYLSNEYSNFREKISSTLILWIIILITLKFPLSIVIGTVLYSGSSVQLSNTKNWKVWKKYELKRY